MLIYTLSKVHMIHLHLLVLMLRAAPWAASPQIPTQALCAIGSRHHTTVTEIVCTNRVGVGGLQAELTVLI